jgi:zinc protease
VVLKPTTFKQDEILLRAFSPGGTSLASDQDYMSATTAAQVVAAGGLGQFSAIDLRKVLTGKAANVGPAFGEISEELSGNASPKDLETMFQLLYMRFTAPRADPTIFQVMTEQTKIALADQKNSPDFAFSQAMSEAMWGNHPRARPMTPERVDEMSLDKSVTFYKDRFKDASDFTFVFVGTFDLATMRPFVEKYVASLPSVRRSETWRNVDMHRATGVVTRRVNKGIEPKSETVITFSGPFQYDQKHRIDLRIMTMVLEGRLREALREDLGGTYGVSVSPGYNKIPRQEYTVTVSFGSAPDRADALVDTVFKKIDELKATGPNASELASFREILLRDYESNTKTNGFFLREIATRIQFGEDLTDLFNLPRFYNELTPATVQDTAKQYLNVNNYVKVQLFPEQK